MTSPRAVLQFAPEPLDGAAPEYAEGEGVDVLILTALEHELDAVLALETGWAARKDRAGFPYHRRSFDRGGGKRPLVVAAAWLGQMGEVGVAIRGGPLVQELEPACVAMCGICAGLRGEVALGDVIVADRVYSYDHGKLIAAPGKPEEHQHDIETHSLPPLLKMEASSLKREVDLPALQRDRPPSRDAQRRWLLHAQHAHEAEGGPMPVSIAERKRACPGWSQRIEEVITDGLATLDDGVLALTPAGRKLVLNERMLYPDTLPEDPPLQVHVGAVATGKTVREDPELFTRLRRVVRKTIGVEMEGAAIGELARHFQTSGIVVKAVSDHADLKKDDSFRKFACRASAVVLMTFLLKHFEPEGGARRVQRRESENEGERDDDGARGERRGLDDGRDGFLARVERVAQLRDPGAKVARRRAAAPFSGVLEIAVTVREGALVHLQIVSASDQAVSEALVAQYVMEVDLPYRRENPSLSSTLIHGGQEAPIELARSAQRRGVTLKSFATYQGLIDFTGYLARQTERLEADAVYPPWLYVEQPAKWSLAGGREAV